MTRKKSKIVRKFMDCSKVDKICILIVVMAVIVGTILGGYYGYYTTSQKPLTQEEIDEMYNIAASAKASELIIDNNYIITISNDEISVETHDDCKGILKMDLISKYSNYEIEYRHNVMYTVYMIIVYSFSFFAMIYILEIIVVLILFVISKNKRVIKK